MLTDRHGIPISCESEGANRHDCVPVPPTFAGVVGSGLVKDVDAFWFDRGCDNEVVHRQLAAAGITDTVIAKRRKAGTATTAIKVPMGVC